MKKFLVTGATGFLGRRLIERLLTQLANDPDAAPIRVLARGAHPWQEDRRVEVVDGDICDPQAVDRAVAGVAGIFHLAGFVSRHPAQAARLYETHIRGTQNVCASALRHGQPRIVLCSSSGTIAASRQPVMHTEDSPFTYEVVGHWPYYLSKIYQEKLALAYHAHGGLPVVVVCPSLILGPGDERLSSTADVQMFLDGSIANVPSGGLNFVDVRDAADGFIRAMEVGVLGRRYLLGAYNLTIKEFFALLERLSGVRGPRWELPEPWARRGAALLRRLYSMVGRRFPLDDVTVEMAYRFWYFDNARARAELGFAPRSAEETIRDTVAYLRARNSRPGKAGP